MPSRDDLSKAAAILQKVQSELKKKGDDSHEAELQAMMSLMESPVFRQMVQLQASIRKLKEEVKKDDFDPSKVDFAPGSGALVIDGEEVPTNDALNAEDEYINMEEFIQTAAQGRETDHIDIFKSQTEGLGFSVVGLRSEHRGDLGIFVQDIKPGGVADRDGRLKESDQILVINDRPLIPTISHKQAIEILQRVQGSVRLVVARGGIPSGDQGLQDCSNLSRSSSMVSSLSQASGIPQDTKWSDVETIELKNDGRGLGFGIVGGRATGGVVVKTIVPNGVADQDGRLQSGDHILRIGDTDVTDMGSEQAAIVLRQCGVIVRLVVARGALEDGDEDSYNDEQDEKAHDTRSDTSISSDEDLDSSSDESKEQSTLLSESQVYEVELVKDAQGLGITISGFLPDGKFKEEGSGIYVTAIAPGSAADVDRRIAVGDQILAVEGKRLDTDNITNQEAVDALRSTGVVVRLTMARLNSKTNGDTRFSSFADIEPHQPEPELLFSGELSLEEEERIKQRWRLVMGPNYDIVVAQLKKYNYTSGLGISLEGTIDNHDRPHHYIRSILQEGPVGKNDRLKPGDELLEVNGNKLHGLNHVEVVVILKELPLHVQMVCARPRQQDLRNVARNSVVIVEEDGDFLELEPQNPLGNQDFQRTAPNDTDSSLSSSSEDSIAMIKKQLPKMPSDQQFPSHVVSTSPQFPESLSDSSEESEIAALPVPLNSPKDTEENKEATSAWENEVSVIKLEKGDRGLGFSILDFQDPLHEDRTAVLVRSLVEGGVAENDGRLEPGDRLIFVNHQSLEFADLDKAVSVLKAVPKGVVTIGVAKPRPMFRAPSSTEEDGVASHAHEQPHEDALPFLPTPPPSSSSSSSSSEDERESEQSVPPVYLPVHDAVKKLSEPRETKSLSEDVRPVEQYSADARRGEARISSSDSDASRLPPPKPSVVIKKPPSQHMGVKQINMSGMTAIALTRNTGVARSEPPEPMRPPAVRQPEPVRNIPMPSIPPKPVGYSAPSWQNAEPAEPRPKPPIDGFERIAQMSKGASGLGITVSPDKEGDGLIVRSVIAGGAVARAGEPKIGDMIRHMNHDSAVGLGAAQARSLIRNHSLYSSDVKISYIPKRYIEAFKQGLPVPDDDDEDNAASNDAVTPKTPTRVGHFAALKSKFETPGETEEQPVHPTPIKATLWGPIQRVDIVRSPGQSLGISIVGGQNDSTAEQIQMENGDIVQGIFIKHVVPDGPVGLDGRMKAGDRILKVDASDLGNASHEYAVEAVRKAGVHVTFIIQSFVGQPKKTLPKPVEVKKESKVEAAKKKYGHLPGEILVIELTKGSGGVGLSLAGNKEKLQQSIFVVGVNPSGAAGLDGRIKVGDELLEINDTPLNVPNNHQLASNVIRNADSQLVFVINRTHVEAKVDRVKPLKKPNHHQHQESLEGHGFSSSSKRSGNSDGRQSPYSDVRVIKLVKDFQGLGFAIAETSTGIVVQSIAKGGTAHRDGRLMKGDHILAVDDRSVTGVSYETAISILKQVRGTVKLTVASGPLSSPTPSG